MWKSDSEESWWEQNCFLWNNVSEESSTATPGSQEKQANGSWSKLSLKCCYRPKWQNWSCPTSGTSWEGGLFGKDNNAGEGWGGGGGEFYREKRMSKYGDGLIPQKKPRVSSSWAGLLSTGCSEHHSFTGSQESELTQQHITHTHYCSVFKWLIFLETKIAITNYHKLGQKYILSQLCR